MTVSTINLTNKPFLCSDMADAQYPGSLVASAPELAEALRELLHICQHKCSPLDETLLPNGKSNEGAMIDAIAALQKAGIEML